jgi:hypothetical protein
LLQPSALARLAHSVHRGCGAGKAVHSIRRRRNTPSASARIHCVTLWDRLLPPLHAMARSRGPMQMARSAPMRAEAASLNWACPVTSGLPGGAAVMGVKVREERITACPKPGTPLPPSFPPAAPARLPIPRLPPQAFPDLLRCTATLHRVPRFSSYPSGHIHPRIGSHIPCEAQLPPLLHATNPWRIVRIRESALAPPVGSIGRNCPSAPVFSAHSLNRPILRTSNVDTVRKMLQWRYSALHHLFRVRLDHFLHLAHAGHLRGLSGLPFGHRSPSRARKSTPRSGSTGFSNDRLQENQHAALAA